MASISTGLPLATDTTPRTSCGIRSPSDLRISQEAAGDHYPLHLVGSLVDLGDLGVAEVALHRELLDVAVATEKLDAVGGHLHRRVRREALRHGADLRQLPARVTLVDQRRGPIDEPARRLRLHGHVGEHELQALKVGDRSPELLAGLDVAGRVVDSALGDADGLGADGGPAAVE